MQWMTAPKSSSPPAFAPIVSSRNKKLAATSLRWVGRSLDHQVEEVGQFRGNISGLRQAMDDLTASCTEYQAAQQRLKAKVHRLRGKSLRLARIADGWA